MARPSAPPTTTAFAATMEWVNASAPQVSKMQHETWEDIFLLLTDDRTDAAGKWSAARSNHNQMWLVE